MTKLTDETKTLTDTLMKLWGEIDVDQLNKIDLTVESAGHMFINKMSELQIITTEKMEEINSKLFNLNNDREVKKLSDKIDKSVDVLHSLFELIKVEFKDFEQSSLFINSNDKKSLLTLHNAKQSLFNNYIKKYEDIIVPIQIPEIVKNLEALQDKLDTNKAKQLELQAEKDDLQKQIEDLK